VMRVIHYQHEYNCIRVLGERNTFYLM